jgi:hypothetical protein
MAQAKKGDMRMFEKEAEIYTEEYYYETPKQFFLAGAKIGYIKAKEWHKGQLPDVTENNRNTLYLAWTKYGRAGSPCIVTPLKVKYINLWTGAIVDKEDVVSWKEIELPTE